MPNQDVSDHQWRVIYCNVEYLNFGTQNLRPSNVKVIFQQPSCSYPYSSGFRFHCQYCPCVWNWLLFLVCRIVITLKVVIFSVLSPMFATVANVEALPLAWRTAVNRKKDGRGHFQLLQFDAVNSAKWLPPWCHFLLNYLTVAQSYICTWNYITALSRKLLCLLTCLLVYSKTWLLWLCTGRPLLAFRNFKKLHWFHKLLVCVVCERTPTTTVTVTYSFSQ